MEEWKSVLNNELPEEGLCVQVTYLGYNDNVCHCTQFAYRNGDKWMWSLDDTCVDAIIVAWRNNCDAYKASDEEIKTLRKLDLYS